MFGLWPNQDIWGSRLVVTKTNNRENNGHTTQCHQVCSLAPASIGQWTSFSRFFWPACLSSDVEVESPSCSISSSPGPTPADPSTGPVMPQKLQKNAQTGHYIELGGYQYWPVLVPRGIRLYTYEQIPVFLRENPYITDGYRAYLPSRLCIKRWTSSIDSVSTHHRRESVFPLHRSWEKFISSRDFVQNIVSNRRGSWLSYKRVGKLNISFFLHLQQVPFIVLSRAPVFVFIYNKVFLLNFKISSFNCIYLSYGFENTFSCLLYKYSWTKYINIHNTDVVSIPELRVWLCSCSCSMKICDFKYYGLCCWNHWSQSVSKRWFYVIIWFCSIFILSNESVNIWSHLLGFLLFFFLGVYNMASVLPGFGASKEDYVIYSIALFCFQVQDQVLLLTSCFHSHVTSFHCCDVTSCSFPLTSHPVLPLWRPPAVYAVFGGLPPVLLPSLGEDQPPLDGAGLCRRLHRHPGLLRPRSLLHLLLQ